MQGRIDDLDIGFLGVERLFAHCFIIFAENFIAYFRNKAVITAVKQLRDRLILFFVYVREQFLRRIGAYLAAGLVIDLIAVILLRIVRGGYHNTGAAA